jgi:ABC-type sugar transport system ATPase subunit
VFLFDEPLSNLDAALRGHMRVELKRLHRRLGTTIFHVTHDQVEALTLADRIVLLDRGRVQQIGSPRDVFDRPANTFVAAFVGAPTMNLLPATAHAGRATLDGTSQGVPADGDGPITLGIRPGDLRLDPAGDLRGVVDVVESLGDEAILHVDLDGARLVARIPGTSPPTPGASVTLAPTVLHRFDRETGARLP